MEYIDWLGGLLAGPNHGEYAMMFYPYWELVDTALESGQISPTLNYFGGSEAFPWVANGFGSAPLLYKMEVGDVTRRLRRLFNTFWYWNSFPDVLLISVLIHPRQASIGPNAYNSTIPQGDPAAFMSGKTANQSNLVYSMTLNSSDATFERDITIYKTDKWWLVITIIATCILLAVGFVGFAAKCACVGPDLLNSFNHYGKGESACGEIAER